MRSLLSQSQTPTAPRRAVGFVRFVCSASCLAKLITQSSSGLQILFREPFRPSTQTNLAEHSQMSTQTIGAAQYHQAVQNKKPNLL
jgi:hypothetical protein